MSQLERWVLIGFFAIVFMMCIGAGLALDSRKACRMELAKQNRTAEDIVKICPQEIEMNRFTNWYRTYYNEITWFIVGWLSMCVIVDFSKGDWTGVVFDIGLIALNYFLNKRS